MDFRRIQRIENKFLLHLEFRLCQELQWKKWCFHFISTPQMTVDLSIHAATIEAESRDVQPKSMEYS